MARMAASFTCSGAEKSGNPCARFRASCSMASRVISRITDSVNCCALREINARRVICIILGLTRWLRFPDAIHHPPEAVYSDLPQAEKSSPHRLLRCASFYSRARQEPGPWVKDGFESSHGCPHGLTLKRGGDGKRYVPMLQLLATQPFGCEPAPARSSAAAACSWSERAHFLKRASPVSKLR